MTNNVPSSRKWDPWTTFSCSKAEYDLAVQRKAVSEQSKLDFQRMIQNPKLQSGEGGAHFDPAVQRWYSARATFGKTYVAGRNSAWSILFLYVIPVALITTIVHKDRERKEKTMRSGECKTKEKLFKMHY